MSDVDIVSPSEPAARITDYRGHLMLVHPIRIVTFGHRDGNTVDDAVHCDVVVLDAEEGPLVLRGLTVTQGPLRRTLRRRMDQAVAGRRPLVLARLELVQNPHVPDRWMWVFTDPSPSDADLARLFVEEHGDPFAGGNVAA